MVVARPKTSVENEIEHLRGLDLKGLRARWQSVFQKTGSGSSDTASVVLRSSPTGSKQIASAISITQLSRCSIERLARRKEPAMSGPSCQL